MTQDEKHLDLLSIFHYVVGGLAFLFSSMFIIHVLMGIAMVTGKFDEMVSQNPSAPEFPASDFGWIFILFPGTLVLAGWTLAVLIAIAGLKLKRRRSRLFCLVVAGFQCIMMPFGTVLGVFTIVTLMKESVQKLFEANQQE